MALDKKDLRTIEQMFDRLENKINKNIEASKIELKKDIFRVEDKLSAKIEATHNRIDSTESRIISVISQEVGDLAEINREVIKRVDKVDKIDKRLTRVEKELKLKPVEA